PEIDGCVYVGNAATLRPGDMARVRITAADEYDLHGEAV
ncbi:hypothetical protein HRF68_22525, partial [Pseudomonas stutzeri]|nr:hypothetical protein [Stutzerimonas stutzeri]